MHILITAGPTREPIDPVRYITNRSSGKMGYALAQAAAHHDAHVTLISGPTSLNIPEGVDFIPVETADEMYQAVKEFCPKADIAILCAAVADYKLAKIASQKIKKTEEGNSLTLELIKTKDILGSMRSSFGFTGYLVGFAAETNNVETYGQEKLKRKQCNLIVANDVSQSGIGFDSNDNAVSLIYPEGIERLERTSKTEIARLLIHSILRDAEKHNAL